MYELLAYEQVCSAIILLHQKVSDAFEGPFKKETCFFISLTLSTMG